MKDSLDDFDFFEFVYHIRDKHCVECIKENDDYGGKRCLWCMFGAYLNEYYIFIGYDVRTANQKTIELIHREITK